MFDPNAWTVGEVVTLVRNVGILVAILGVGWKARALVQPVVDFFADLKRLMIRGEKHMDAMEESMSLLLDNHLTHIGSHVATVARHQVRGAASDVATFDSEEAASEIVAEGPAPEGQEPRVL